jgi:uncharacterized protein YbjT (DUF2867 family)
LGRRLVADLVARGERVRVLTRDASRAAELSGAEIVVGDLRDATAVENAVRGVDAVVSAAHGFVGTGGVTPESIDRDANRTLVHAARDAGVKRFVLVSMQGASADHPMSLARAKLAAEEELIKSGLPYAILRAAAFIETWVMVLGERRAPVFGPGTNPISFVSVRDVASLAMLALDGALDGETVEIGGPEAIGLLAVAERVAKKPIKHVPLAALRAISIVARLFAPAFARQATAAVAMNTMNMVVSSAVRTRFPALPATTLDDVLAG